MLNYAAEERIAQGQVDMDASGVSYVKRDLSSLIGNSTNLQKQDIIQGSHSMMAQNYHTTKGAPHAKVTLPGEVVGPLVR